MTAALPVICSRPAFSIVLAAWSWNVPADQFVVPFSRRVWSASKKSIVFVIDVRESGEKAVRKASQEDFEDLDGLIQRFCVKVAARHGWRAEPLSLYRGSAQNVVYQCYTMTRSQAGGNS